MVRGAIVAESLRLGASIDDVPLIVKRLERVRAGVGEQPAEWTLIWFEAADEDSARLADAVANALATEGGWYADFHSDVEVFVVFAGRVFRYRQGDAAERARVADYARSVGVPENQLDWAE
ncbi:MAG: hypothetical protein ACYDH6_18595 [Acidimicrobiales bacterium]